MSKAATEVKAASETYSFRWEDPPDSDKFSQCVHCGMCLEACPTYQETALEPHSPRGRVYLIKSAAEGRISLNELFQHPISTCLDCRACETACPSNVQVGSLIEETRGQLYKSDPPKGTARLMHKLFLHWLFPYPKRMHRLGTALRWYQKSGVQTAFRKLKLMKVLPPHLQELELALPRMSRKSVWNGRDQLLPAIGSRRARVAMVTGCVMDVMYSEMNEATVRVLQRNGCDVWIPQAQQCCGALHLHAGDRDKAKALARHNLDAFLSQGIDAVIINAAGCGSALKEYDELLHGDPAYADKSKAFTSKVKDISEFLIELGLIPPKSPLDLNVTYHDACHLAHAQGILRQPREILQSIPGLKLVDLPDSDRCCGSAGIYNLTHPEMAGALLDRKMADIPAGCDAVAMGNPGCIMQFGVGVVRHNRQERIVHTVQLLDWAYAEEDRQNAGQPASGGVSNG